MDDKEKNDVGATACSLLATVVFAIVVFVVIVLYVIATSGG